MRISYSELSLSDARWEAVPIAEPLAGEAKQIRRAWSRVRVPGHWQLEDALGDYEGYVLYRARFEAVPAGDGEFVWLRFGGVYYSARVWLNGEYLGAHEGYFSHFEFDCTESLVEGENELLVEVYSPEEREENTRETIGGVWARWDGMDPGINPGGIFRDVTLVRRGEVRVLAVGVDVGPSGDGRVTLDLYARSGSQVEISGSVHPMDFEAPGAEFRHTARVEPGENRVGTKFTLREPRLWWTWDRGEQHLYELVLRCAGAEERVRFGVRSVELRDWQVYLNGERVFMRGINYLPTDAYPARTTGERLRADAALVRDGNMNAVRVHAHVAEEAFYEACDELGLLVFQDFPLQWSHRRTVLGPAVAQAKEMARDLRNHPSVGVYLAHDEPFYVVPPEKWSVFTLARTAAEVLSPRWVLWQRRVLGPAVVGAIHEVDDSRPVIEAAGHPFTTNHLYFGWYYGRFRDLERLVGLIPGFSRLPTEYGAQALPDPASLEEIWPDGLAPGLADALRRLPAAGRADGTLRSLEGRPPGVRPGHPGVSGRGPEARDGAVPAAQVSADRRNVRVHAQRSRTGHLVVGDRLEAQAQSGLRGSFSRDEPRPRLRGVSRRASTPLVRRCRYRCTPSTTSDGISARCDGPGRSLSKARAWPRVPGRRRSPPIP